MDEVLTFGQWLKGRRREYGYTQRELAELVGCSVVTIEKIEAGKNRPSRQIAELIGQAVGVPPAEYEAFVRFARSMPRQPEPPAPSAFAAHALALPGEYPASTLAPRPDTLPVQLTPLIGREREADEVCALVRRPDVRLVTLTGPGGIGKTRLALRVATQLFPEFRDGVVFVGLASTTDPALVTTAIAQCLGVNEVRGRPLLQTLQDFLHEKEMLLLLDNFEQVIASSHLVVDLLTTCRSLKVLVTSREVLQVRGERPYQVPPLELPDLTQMPPIQQLLDFPSVSLFVERAQSVKDDFELTEENGYAVAAICNGLDGLPLAIELAAVRIKLFSPQVLLSRLDNSLKILTGGPRDLPERQQTLRDAIGWSYNLLTPEEQTVFSRLAVFVGGCTLAAAEAVIGGSGSVAPEANSHLLTPILDIVESLLDKSLLKYEQSRDEGPGSEPRFAMLGTIRDYALERLRETGEGYETRHLHALYYLSLAQEADPYLTGSQQLLWLERLEHDHDNFRAALSWAIEKGECELAAGMGGALWRFWYVRGHFSEGRMWLVRILNSCTQTDEPEAPPAVSDAEFKTQNSKLKIPVLTGAGWLAFNQGDYEQAWELAAEGTSLARQLEEDPALALGLYTMGSVELERGNHPRATALHEEALGITRERNERWGMAAVLNGLGSSAMRRGDLDRAEPLLEESLSVARSIGDLRGIASALLNLGMLTHQRGDRERALGLLEESLNIARQLKDLRGISWALNDLGIIALEQNNWQHAKELVLESLTLTQKLGDKENIALGLERLAIAALAEGKPDRAARLLGAMKSLRDTIGTPLAPDNQSHYFGVVAGTRAALGSEAYAKAWAEGQAMGLEQAIGYAMEDR